jgi:hypothetical protein
MKKTALSAALLLATLTCQAAGIPWTTLQDPQKPGPLEKSLVAKEVTRREHVDVRLSDVDIAQAGSATVHLKGRDVAMRYGFVDPLRGCNENDDAAWAACEKEVQSNPLGFRVVSYTSAKKSP